MLNLLLFAICVSNGVIIFKLVKSLLLGALGDSKVFRTLNLFVAFPCGAAYTIFALNTGLVATNVSFLFGLAAIFGPISAIGVIAILRYIGNGK